MKSVAQIMMSLALCGIILLPGLVSIAAPSPQKSVQDVYLDKCSVCHAKDGSGNTVKGRKVKAKDLRSDEIQKMTDPDLLKDIGQGKGKDMDGFEKELGADMVKELLTYCRGFGKK